MISNIDIYVEFLGGEPREVFGYSTDEELELEFISLMKDSIRDILVTGDQSLTDILSCCKKKRVWYQIAPWKKGLAQNLEKHLPNKYYDSFKTSCGTVKSVDLDIDWRSFMKDYDFRIHGRKRMNSILIAHYHSKDKKYYKDLPFNKSAVALYEWSPIAD